MEDGSKPALCEGAALLTERFSVLDLEVSLVDDNKAERALACSIKQGLDRVRVIDEKLGGEEHKFGVLTRPLR